MRFICDIERDIAKFVSELQLYVLTADPFESRWLRFSANHGTGFTDKMCMINCTALFQNCQCFIPVDVSLEYSWLCALDI